jgi:putative Holliday junction resolvase
VLADARGVRRFVVGLPLDMRGGEGAAARKARAMAQRIADATGRLVELWDERLTTVQAKQALAASEVRGRRARDLVDEAAACAILQSWLDARRSRR